MRIFHEYIFLNLTYSLRDTPDGHITILTTLPIFALPIYRIYQYKYIINIDNAVTIFNCDTNFGL